MSNTYEYQSIEFKVRTRTLEDGERVKTISIFVNDEEVVYGAESLEEAIKQFDYNF